MIGVVEKDGRILMRKKPDGSLPYKETWYLFGGEVTPDSTPEDTIVREVKNKTGVSVRVSSKVSWGTEVKKDLDGKEKLFVYLDVICEYIAGEATLTEGIEKLEWAAKEQLSDYDIVPPSKKLFQELGYMK